MVLPKYRKFAVFIFVAIAGLCLFFKSTFPAFAFTPGFKESVSHSASVSATVGQFTLSLQGYLAPFASIVLSVDGVVLRSTVADATGNFSISQVLIKQGFDHFCLDGVDFKRLGESEACFTVSPATGSIVMTNIFLPPTLGVFRADVNVGDKALAWGYGMPGAKITVHIDNAIGCSVFADATGYYQCQILISKGGTHTLYADAVLNGKPSEPQLKKVIVQGLTLPEQIGKTTAQQGKNLWQLLTNLPGGIFLLLVLLLIILILILIKKLKPGWLPWLPNIGVPHVSFEHAFDFLFREKKLHHFWMKGVGY